MHISRIHLEKICGIDCLDLQFTSRQETRSASIMIGRNGAGKSTILRAVALGLASDAEVTALLAERFGSPFVTSGEIEGFLEIDLVDEFGKVVRPPTKVIRKHGDHLEYEKVTVQTRDAIYGQIPLVVAFGAGRSNVGWDSSGKKYSIVESTYMLFDYEAPFTDPELTLRRLKEYVSKRVYETVLRLIGAALEFGETDVLRVERGGGIVVSGPRSNSTIPIDSWADGYRVTLNWILDIYAWAMRHPGAIDSEGNVHGILVVDEIEQHLHPSMQRRIVECVKDLFPRMQVLASTHSPSVLQGIDPSEVIALHREESSVTAIESPDYSGSSVEDVLTSDLLFDTEAYSTEVERLRREYMWLIRKSHLSVHEESRLASLANELADLRLISAGDAGQDVFDRVMAQLARLGEAEDRQR